MAITWGAVEGTNSEKVGIEVTMSPATVVYGTASVVLTVKYYVRSQYDVNDNQTLTLSGALTGSYTSGLDPLNQVGVDVLVVTRTLTVPTVLNQAVPKTFASAISGHYGGATPSVSVPFSVPARPYYTAPTAPDAVTATRVSDTQINVAGTTHATSDAPYTTFNLQRRRCVSGAWESWATIKTGLTVCAYSDTTIVADGDYEHRYYVANNGGSAYSTAAACVTTPANPSNVVATKSVSDIVITFDIESTIAAAQHKVYESQDGGAYSLKTTLAAGVATYTHVAPSASVTHKYKVTAIASTLESAGAESNTVQLLAPPNAPTGLALPSVFDAANPQALVWQHNPVDGTGQTYYDLRYRLAGAETWTDITAVASTVSAHEFAAGTFANGSGYEAQVCAKGQHADYSPWSASLTFETSAIPAATINSPADLSTLTSPSVTVEWGYYDAEGTAQSARRVTLYASDGTTVLWSSTVAGAAVSAAIGYVLANAATYVIGVTARDGSGLWSAEDTVTVTVDYAEPMTPAVEVAYDVETGSAFISIDNDYHYDVVSGAEADWRLIAQGDHYGNFYDPVSGTWATVTRATAKTARRADGTVCDVPAGYLALDDWEGGTGYASQIEAGATNTFLQSTFADQAALDTWTKDAGLTAVLQAGGTYDNGHDVLLSADASNRAFWRTLTSTAATRVVCFEVCRADGSAVTSADCQIAVLAGSSTPAGALLTTTFWHINSGHYLAFAAYTGTAATWACGLAVKAGKSVYAACPMEHLGSAPHSFIPTTAATSACDSDVVTVPSAGLTAASGTIVAVAKRQWAGGTRHLAHVPATSASKNTIAIYQGSSSAVQGFWYGADAAVTYASVDTPNNAVGVYGLKWSGTSTWAFANGLAGATGSTDLMDGIASIVYAGSNAGGAQWGASIARLLFFSAALTAPELAAPEMTSGLLAGVDGTNHTGEPQAVYNDLYRIINGAPSLVAGSVGPNGTATDYLPLTKGTTGYYAVAYSALPSAATSATVDLVTTGADGWIYLNGGDGFGDSVALRYGPGWQASPGREKALIYCASTGEDNYPLEFSSSRKSHVVAVSGYLYDTAARDALLALALLPGPHFLRDCKANYMRCSISNVDINEAATSKIQVSFTATRTSA